MDEQKSEIKTTAIQLLAGMLANPHIYASISEEEGRGQQEKMLIVTAIEMAEKLLDEVKTRGQ